MAEKQKYTDAQLVKHLRCENPADKEKLEAALDGLMKLHGATKVGQIVPSLVNLIEAEGIDVPESITSHVQTVVASLDVVRAEMQAIAASYGTVEQVEREKHAAVTTSQANRIAELEAQLQQADDEHEATKFDLRNAKLNEDYFERRFHATEEKLAAITAERDKLVDAVGVLTAALGADDAQRASVLAALASAPAEEPSADSDVDEEQAVDSPAEPDAPSEGQMSVFDALEGGDSDGQPN